MSTLSETSSRSSLRVGQAILTLAAVAMLIALYLVFMVVPNERMMGPVQRIFYFHVGSAFACYCSVAVMLIAGLWYLATRSSRADAVQEAASEVGLVFCTIVLVSGMIWAKAAWNIAFSWREPRLVSFLCLWLIFVGVTMLRRFGDRERIGAHSAVLAILGAITVPVVVYSVKFLSHVGQLHPVVVENRGLKDPMFQTAFLYCSLTLVLLQFVFIWLRYRVACVESDINNRG